MTTDNTPATLATAKHGGCVQLGDAPFAWSERAKSNALEAGQSAFTEADGNDLGYTACIEACVDAICSVLALPEHRAALAARQPVGEQVGVTQFRHPGCTDWYDVTEGNQHVLADPDFEKRTLYAAPPAQAVDLGPVPLIARALAEWHEDDGNVLWWAWCGRDWAGEPAWAGTPNDSDWPGYHTHWTPHPTQPALLDSQAVGNG